MATQRKLREAKLQDLPGILRTDLSAFDGNAQRIESLKNGGPEALKKRLSDKYTKFINNPQRYKMNVIELNGDIISIGVLDFKPREDDIRLKAADVTSKLYNAYHDVFLKYFMTYGKDFAILRTLATHQDNQRQGCGKAIWDSLKKDKGLGEKQVIAVYSSTMAQAFYEREGFRLVGTRGTDENPALGYIFDPFL